MRTFRVGGAVRDALLGLPVNDTDWVVVGATPEEMIQAGYLPVGKDFPVFLHPDTREEHALARTERKTGRGYRGFSFHTSAEVTLEEDLARRDLTINAIAQADDGSLIDPFGGQQDLRRKVLRHVTESFREDPVRILRVARFGARFHDFALAPETLDLMRAMVAEGEADHLVPERVWQELARGLMEPRPARMLEILQACGALARIVPEVAASEAILRVVDRAASVDAPLPVRFACLTAGLEAAQVKQLCERLRVPNECRELAEVVARERAAIDSTPPADAEAMVRLLERCDAFRKPQRFEDVLLACECIARSASGERPYPQRPQLSAALRAARSVDTSVIAARARDEGLAGDAIGQRIQQARVQVVRDAQTSRASAA
ncbi:multifunctional CCA addition/repair protein [Ramlibacter sp. USB13]|uniref:CCA-adding enzyme n=1 Tax=Ramlibacter cellulosilyticus TaxID=2764187 RepID=A0A923MU46_9BURK|nr:multifunctional CCA addition/repair protein [Ramlibacter cellulosilyticus]MBC5784679.1 multifunctional CCA addition/repair protein [Ramlibacter cellulosilyticus]